MAFEELERHISGLGGLEKQGGGKPQPLSDADLSALSRLLGAPLPASLRWWFSKYGAGVQFVEPIVYPDPEEHEDVLLGEFIEADAIRQTIEDFEGAIAKQRLPINDDGFGNFIGVDSRGVVAKHYHDAPPGEAERRLADSFEKFLLMLRRGE
jgi:hypothetical protein